MNHSWSLHRAAPRLTLATALISSLVVLDASAQMRPQPARSAPVRSTPARSTPARSTTPRPQNPWRNPGAKNRETLQRMLEENCESTDGRRVPGTSKRPKVPGAPWTAPAEETPEQRAMKAAREFRATRVEGRELAKSVDRVRKT
ncbi:MAG: hypothetical protein KDC95_22785, partial [Planctomycetes bacterium]|nr:hypothetical protein [Planctomycetota bacterium]